jgi:WhiB family transcriptional regulator, redox-sensing transcriptional regulator
MPTTNHNTPAAPRPRDTPPINPVRLPPPVFEEWEWQLQGSCRGQPTDVFFPEGLRGARLKRLEYRAKRICADCPVLVQCRDHALRTPEAWGIWGAMTSRERADLYLPNTLT